MKLSSKITTVAVAAVVLTGVSAALTVRALSTRNRVNAIHEEMAVVLHQAEAVASHMDRMHRSQSFDVRGLLERARATGGEQSLRETYQQTDFYATIPVVASWTAATSAAEKLDFEFITPSRPDLPPRNPKNISPPELIPAFTAFADGQSEYFHYDNESRQIILAKPVRLQQSCLACHGDPATSRNGDGHDVLGFPMEGMREGDIKGAFVLKTHLKNDPVIASTMQKMAGVTGLVILFVIGGLIEFNRRFVNRPLRRVIGQIEVATEQTAVAAEQVAATSQSLADGANAQAASLEETGASLEQMSGVTKQTAESTRAANDAAAQTRASADAGVARMADMDAAMKAIQHASEDITKILRTIDDIAFQTNILALNAAVEAARAGPAGAGFAVVADEVRALAQRAAAAARETAVKIEDCVQRSQHGVKLSAEVAEQLATIQTHAQKMDTLVTEITRSAHEQSQGIQQVTEAMSQVDRVTQQSAAAAEEGAAAASDLRTQSAQISRTVGDLQRLVGAESAQSSRLRERARPDDGRLQTPPDRTSEPLASLPKMLPCRRLPTATADRQTLLSRN